MLIKRHWQAFLVAVQFMTLIPVHLHPYPPATIQARASLYYPLVGALLGLLLWLAAQWLSVLALPVAAALLLTGWVLITGGLHLDGLADSFDGLVGGLGDRSKTLRIMQDPCIGSSAALALILLLLLKWTALTTLLHSGQLHWLIVAPILGRLAAAGLLLSTPYVRANGIFSRQHTALPRALLATHLALWGGLFLLAYPLLLLAVLLQSALWRHWLMRRLGGSTGDNTGALIELTELLVLLIATM